MQLLTGSWKRSAPAIVTIGILLPVFFTLDGRVYRRPLYPLEDSGGVLTAVPLPVSIVICAAAIALAADYRKAAIGIVAAAAFVVAMIATMLTWGGAGRQKLLLLAQYAIPFMGLVVGLLFDKDEHWPGIWLWLVIGIMGVQLAIPFLQHGVAAFHHDMLLFSIYQHRQSVPVVFVAAYMVATYAAWDTSSRHIRWTAVAVGCYAMMSLSMLAIGLFVMGLGMLAWLRRDRLLAELGVLAIVLGIWLNGHQVAAMQKFAIFAFDPSWSGRPPRIFHLPMGDLRLPLNLEQRLYDWTLYAPGIVETARTFFFGHAEPFPRSVSTSAHNYYLDLAYNFGTVALLPFAVLFAHTVRLLWHARAAVCSSLPLAGLAFVVLYLVVCDNNMKVTFRQPYPGIFGFFLWGVLLSSLGRRAAGWRPHRRPSSILAAAVSPARKRPYGK